MSATTEEDTKIRIDLITSENNSIEILKSQRNDQPHTPPSPAAMSTAQMKVDLIDYYERMICEVDLHAERLIQSLPEALENSRQELLERIEREKAKSLAALGMTFEMNLQLTFKNKQISVQGPDSAVVQRKNEYYERFVELRDEYRALGGSVADEKRRGELLVSLEALKRDVVVLEEFLEEFRTRTLHFEEVDKSVFEGLIGELVLTNSENQQVDPDLDVSRVTP